MIEQIPTRIGMQEFKAHQAAMRGGDDTLSYTQTGEIIIPVEIQERFPGLAEAALAAIAHHGENPARYIAGSPEGSYNPQTGAQEFFLTGLLDWASSSNVGRSLTTGLGSAAVAKLTGSSTKQALATGAGAGLGYMAGNAVGNWTSPSPEPATPAEPRAPSESMGEAFRNFGSSFTTSGLTGAALGGLAGYALVPTETKLPKLNFDPNAPSSISDMPAPTPVPELSNSERANVSATLPQSLPVAPMTPRGLPAGVNLLQQTQDRYTGQNTLNDVTGDPGVFSRAINEMDSQRRRAGFGNIMFV